mgnify:CR=1 FL=1
MKTTIAVIGLALLAVPAHAVEWPDYQKKLRAGESKSLRKAKLPGSLRIEKPSKGIRSELRAYSGVWSGWLCRNGTTDVKVAVKRVTRTGAAVVYAVAARRIKPRHFDVAAKWKAGVLEFDLPRSSAVVYLRRRPDGNLDIKWERWPRWCTGVLNKIR